MEMPKMRFLHDCDACKSLGLFGRADLYFCNQSEKSTVIARYSDEPGDYKSGMMFANVDPDLKEAKRRAISLGHLAI